MADYSKSLPLNFIVCQNCHGYGFINDKKCAQCHGLGVVLPFYGKFLFWGKKIDRLNIAVDKSLALANRLINLLLVVFGLFGFTVLLYISYQLNFTNLLDLNYWLTASWEKAVFWFTMLTNLYLYYRLEQAASPRRRVLPKVFLKPREAPASLDWRTILSQPRRNLIDISECFSEPAINLIEQAYELARQFKHAQCERLHIFAVAPRFDDGALVWGRLGIDVEKFNEKISRVLSWKLEAQANAADMPPLIYKVFIDAYLHAYETSRLKVSPTEIILALTDLELLSANEAADDYIEKILIELDLNYQKIINVIEWIRVQRQLREGLQHFRARARYRSKSGLDKAMTAVATPMLESFSTDLTLKAKYGQLFPCIGRDKEFEAIYRVIEGSRAGVLLVGQPGVGRTTILEGLAQKMVEEAVPPALRDKRLVSLSVAKLVSGATPAQAEERLLMIASEISRARNIVLVIEDVHGLTGITAGSASSLDLSAVLAELINKGLFLALATTSPREYSQAIEGSALGEVFVPIKIEELEFNDAIQVLEVKSGPIEYKNNVFFSYDSIEKAVQLSIKYLHDQYLPAKALEIMEEAAVNVRKLKGERAVVTGEAIAEIISEKTGVQATKITERESEKLLHLEDEIHERIIGQSEAVRMVASSLRRARAELRDAKRPIASLLFLGPTGVGKTELAKTVALVYFGKEENMLRFDMSEYQEQSSISRLIGAGGQAGLLTEAVRKNPFSLILFDEIEKAHPDILNLFLQVMDDGRLTDGQGRTVDFTSCIIIMTSNAGAAAIQEDIKNNVAVEMIKERLINQELSQYFRPEFLNRFDGIVVFKPLTMAEVIQIARLLAAKAAKQLAAKNITLKITDAAIAELAEMGYDPKFGARPLRRVIQERVDDTLANYLLQGQIDKRDVVILEPGGKLTIEKAETI